MRTVYTDDDGYEVMKSTHHYWGRFAKATGLVSRFGDTITRAEAEAEIAFWQRTEHRKSLQDQIWDGWFVEVQETVIRRKVERIGETDTIEGVPA